MQMEVFIILTLPFLCSLKSKYSPLPFHLIGARLVIVQVLDYTSSSVFPLLSHCLPLRCFFKRSLSKILRMTVLILKLYFILAVEWLSEYITSDQYVPCICTLKVKIYYACFSCCFWKVLFLGWFKKNNLAPEGLKRSWGGKSTHYTRQRIQIWSVEPTVEKKTCLFKVVYPLHKWYACPKSLYTHHHQHYYHHQHYHHHHWSTH